MQGIFISALTYTPPAVLGRQLLPFSAFHGLLLEAAGSPFLVGGERDFDDVVLGAWVCSHGFADGYFGTMDFKAIRKWGRQARKLKPEDKAEAVLAFEEHIEASLQKPQTWSSKGEKSCRNPIWWLLATFAMSQLHLPETAAWDTAITKLFCYNAARNEADGGEDLMSDDEIGFIDSGDKKL